MTFDSGPERKKLQFEESALDAFRFLIDDYEFRLAKSSPMIIRYIKKDAFVTIVYDYGYYLSVSIGKPARYRGYDLSDVIRLDYDLESSGFLKYRNYQTDNREELARFVYHLADLTREYASPLLRGNEDMFSRLKEETGRRNTIHSDRLQAQPLRRKAEEAFMNGDYKKVVEAYAEIQHKMQTVRLKDSEIKKFEIARRRLEESNTNE